MSWGNPLSLILAAAAAAAGNSIYRNLVCSGAVLGLQSSGQLQQRSGGSFYLISNLWNQELPTLLSSSHQQWKLYNRPDVCTGQKGNILRAKACPTVEIANSSMPSIVQKNTVRNRALLCSLGRLEFTVCRFNTRSASAGTTGMWHHILANLETLEGAHWFKNKLGLMRWFSAHRHLSLSLAV